MHSGIVVKFSPPIYNIFKLFSLPIHSGMEPEICAPTVMRSSSNWDRFPIDSGIFVKSPYIAKFSNFVKLPNDSGMTPEKSLPTDAWDRKINTFRLPLLLQLYH